jgi:hypothetical protein
VGAEKFCVQRWLDQHFGNDFIPTGGFLRDIRGGLRSAGKAAEGPWDQHASNRYEEGKAAGLHASVNVVMGLQVPAAVAGA